MSQQQQAAASSGKQQQTAASSSKQRQAAANSGKQQQAAASSSKQRQAAAAAGGPLQVWTGATIQRNVVQRPPALLVRGVRVGSGCQQLPHRPRVPVDPAKAQRVSVNWASNESKLLPDISRLGRERPEGPRGGGWVGGGRSCAGRFASASSPHPAKCSGVRWP